jgi:glycosyltransferase involved in cell wall biosynthesis
VKLVFVNVLHSDVAHVAGMRVPYLGRELSRRGHRVVLVTPTLAADEPASIPPRGLAGAIAGHDWSQPLHLAVPPRRDAALRAVRDGSLPAAARRLVTLYYQLRHLGVFEDWVSACAPYAKALATTWAPDLVWGTFGNTGSIKVAQRIARESGVPWVIDFKDSWSYFLHPWLRSYMARRFRDASAATANAEFSREVASRWFAPIDTSVIYSGVAEAFFEGETASEAGPRSELLLVGGVYSESLLREFLSALQAWLLASPTSVRESVRLTYLGADGDRVRRVVGAMRLPCALDVQAFVGIVEMARRCQRALACCYIKYHETFHHKLLELLVAGRPVICFPGETDESLALSRSFRTPLFSCASAGELHDGFSRAWQLRGEPRATSPRSPWCWASRAAELEAVFESVLAGRRVAGGERRAPAQGSLTLAGREASPRSQR